MNAFKKTRSHVALSIVSIAYLLIAFGAHAADVSVHGKALYSPNVFKVEIFADIDTVDLVSFGVKLDYDEAGLVVLGASTNEAVWYLGGIGIKYPYVQPDSSVDGEVVFLGGRLDTGSPVGGVTGNKVLLGSVSFACTSCPPPEEWPGVGPVVSLSYGRPGDYKNFVATDGLVLDDELNGVEFRPLPEPGGMIVLLCGAASIFLMGRNRIKI
jgi:hypothetical protein